MRDVEYTHCIVCGRRLKKPENKERGMGKICYEKWRKQRKTRLF